MAKSRNLPGVTKSLQWVRIGGIEGNQEDVLELLDSPGIIPARQVDQEGALKLAICNDIGEASYDRVVVAAAMCDRINTLHRNHPSYVDMRRISDRYEIPYSDMTGEQIVYEVAEKFYQGNSISAADKLLGDFRKGLLGHVSLEAPVLREKKGKAGSSGSSGEGGNDSVYEAAASATNGSGKGGPVVSLDVGKGDYEGW
jgi:ribosome biogenesis GTPase A